MVYVTCSFLMEENEDQVASFLADRPDFKAEDAAEAAIKSGQLTEKGAASSANAAGRMARCGSRHARRGRTASTWR